LLEKTDEITDEMRVCKWEICTKEMASGYLRRFGGFKEIANRIRDLGKKANIPKK
jgi:hypothetical protein